MLETIFKIADVDKDGVLNRKEFVLCMRLIGWTLEDKKAPPQNLPYHLTNLHEYTLLPLNANAVRDLNENTFW